MNRYVAYFEFYEVLQVTKRVPFEEFSLDLLESYKMCIFTNLLNMLARSQRDRPIGKTAEQM